MTALDHLCQLKQIHQRTRYPNVPPFAIPRTKYNDKTANGLTRCILDYLTFRGFFATRIQSQGQYRPGIGWTPGTTRKGPSDIHAVVNGLHLSIEIKAGKDRMSKAQCQMKDAIQRAGGLYFTARSFQQFYDWFNTTVIKKGVAPTP